MASKRYLPVLLFMTLLSSLWGQNVFYWENEQILVPRNARFPRAASTGEEIMVVWQEFNEEEGTVSFFYRHSQDGARWSEPELITDRVNYYWEDPVGLITLLGGRDGRFHVAFPQDELNLGLYVREAGGEGFNLNRVISTSDTKLAPRLYEKSDGGLILFTMENLVGGGFDDRGDGDETAIQSFLQIIYIEEIDGEWTDPALLVNREGLNWNFLPDFHSYQGRDYVVFQSFETGIRSTWQLYIQSRTSSTGTGGVGEWSDPIHLTDRQELYQGELQDYIYFDNQRPHLSSNRDGLVLTWERHYTSLSPQITLARLDDEGRVRGDFEGVTSGFRYNANPRYFEYDGEDYVIWFDNRNGNQVIMTSLDLAYQGGVQMSRSVGNSSYATPVIFKGDLFLFWENRLSDTHRYILLGPDKSVSMPRVTPVSYTLGVRSRKSLVTLNWSRPADSSGINAYRYSWDRNPDTDPSLDGDNPLVYQPRATTFTADEDGLWYFHVSARDNAGNWSDPRHVPYFRDTTPPLPVRFIRPPTDAFGALDTNSPLLAWESEEEVDLAGYSYTLTYLGNDPFDLDRFTLNRPPEKVMTTDRAIKLRNRDNGFWALSVVSLDKTGNAGVPEIFYFRMDKYIPVTYISWIGSSRNREESIVLDIRGRGFSAGGDVVRVIIDKDGKAPWDYEYFLDEDFTVLTDRRLSGPVIDDMRQGVYHVAVEHPERGIVFAGNRIRLDATGNVKFGDFAQRFELGWKLIEDRALRMALNRVFFFLLLLSIVGLIFIVIFKMISLWRENRDLEINARALVKGTHMVSDLIEERLNRMQKKGMRLRTKFTLAFIALVVLIVLLVALVLGNYMITTQQITLGRELEKRSSMMADTLASSAENYLPSQNRIELSLLPQQISAMEEALDTVITGPGYNDPDNFNYIWASLGEEVNEYQVLPETLSAKDYNGIIPFLNEKEKAELDRFYLPEEGGYRFNDELIDESYLCGRLLLKAEFLKPYSVGNTPYRDRIEPLMEDIEEEINARASERVTDMVRDYEQLNAQGTALVLRNDAASRAKLQEIQETQLLLSIQINDTLNEIAETIGVRSNPPFNPEELLFLNEDETVFTFYKPLIYQERGSDTYFRGTVRLKVTVEPLIKQIQDTRQNIIYITGLTFLIAIALSIIGSLLLSSTMVRPIRELAGYVQLIRDTDDITTLEDRMIRVKSRDEIGELGDNVNQMTMQLIKAAAANKELIVGKDMQKAFIPLEERMVGDQRRKLTTGSKQDGNLNFFGYYEGAKGVSGDYFDFRPLDDNHYAVIKCDIAGKGVSASLIMVEVATIFVSHCKDMDPSKGIDLAPLLYNINDLLLEVGFQGRFAALSIMIVNKMTGKCILGHAGDNIFHLYDSRQKRMRVLELPEAPAAGQIDSFLVEMKTPYSQEDFQMNRGDIVFMFTDGIEEAQALFKDDQFNIISCDGSCHKQNESQINHEEGETFEEFGRSRIQEIVHQVMNQGTYELFKYHAGDREQKFEFDFSGCQGTVEEAVTSMTALEKVFRLHPYERAPADHTIQVDVKIEAFLQKHFLQFSDFFKAANRITDPLFPEYVYYRHLNEDDQFDDLTILAVEKT